MTAEFPRASDFKRDEEATKEMALLMGVITGIRNIRGEMNIPPSKKVNLSIDVGDRLEESVLRRNFPHIQTLAKVDDVSIASGLSKPDGSATVVFEKISVHVLLKGLVDFEDEKKRIKKSIKKIEKELEIPNKKLANSGFVEKAPSEIVDQVKEKAEKLSARLSKLNQNLAFFEEIDA
jgi:valyl-tRNA synthetase